MPLMSQRVENACTEAAKVREKNTICCRVFTFMDCLISTFSGSRVSTYLSLLFFIVTQNSYGDATMNVQRAWELGYTGKGVVVSILDDGIEKDHPDLKLNYVSKEFAYHWP